MTSLRSQLAELCRKNNIVAVYAFGSRAKEARESLDCGCLRMSKTSADLDVGILLPRGIRIDVSERVRLATILEDMFEVSRVDLVVLPEASAFLALEVVRGELLVDLSPDDTARFELYVLRRAGDLAYFEHERRSFVLTEGGV